MPNSNFIKRVVFACFLFCFLESVAQNSKSTSQKSVTITGVVIDKDLQQPVEYVNTIIKSKANNTIVTGGITNSKGQFKIEKIPAGNYIFEVQFVGYETFKKEISVSKNSNLGQIYIAQAIEELSGVEITAERSSIEQKIDRKVINVGKDLTATGASAADIMVNIPSVDVDQDGSISLRGNQNVRVLVDGKLTNIDANQLLQQIPSTSIKKIELITNPSAKYNPEGMGGMINIILNKNAKLGFNGNVNLGLDSGIKSRFNGSLGLNYRSGKFNLHGNYGNNMGVNPIRGEIFRPIENSNQFLNTDIDKMSHLLKIGLDYYLNDNNTISFYTNLNTFESNTLSTANILYIDKNIPDLYQENNVEKDNLSQNYNLDYKHNFKKEGETIELEVDYNTLEEDEFADFDFTGVGISFVPYKDDISNERDITVVNLDYVNPLSEKSKLELGGETRFRNAKNTYLTTNANISDSQFTFDRDILSAYTTFSSSFSKFSYQLGARFESYKVNALLNEINKPLNDFKDDIFSIYPSAFIKYTPNEETQKNSYKLSFNRRVDRPSFSQLNPIRLWSTPRIISIGNPMLRPQFSNIVEANYTRKLKKGSITSGVFYRLIEDEINRIGYDNPDDATQIILSYDNYDDTNAYGFELSGSYKITKWWSVFSSFDLYSQKQRGVVEKEYLEVDNLLYNFRINNSFKAMKNLTFQLFGLYRGANENLQFKVEEFYFVNLGARYSFAESRGTFSVNFKDVLDTQSWSFDGERPLKQIGEFNWDTMTVYLGLSYRFGQGKNKALKRKRRDKNEKRSGGFL